MPDHKILVTGATGFIGSYLVRYLLNQGYGHVRGLKRANSDMALVREVASRVVWYEGDVLDIASLEAAMEGVTHVYHCAAVVSFHESDNGRMLEVNQIGTANVVNLSLDLGVSRLVHVSSIAAIGRQPNDPNIDETTQWKQDDHNSPYGVSKHLAELEVWRGMAEGLDAAIVNPSNVLGSGFWQGRTSTGQLFFKIWKGMPFRPLGSSGFVDVRDVVRFMVLLMESGITGQRYILNGENLAFGQLFDLIAKSLGVKPPTVGVTPLLREVAWRIAWLASKFTGRPPFITKQTARSSARHYIYANQKSLAAFPFAYTPIAQTVQDTARQFLASEPQGFRPAVLDF